MAKVAIVLVPIASRGGVYRWAQSTSLLLSEEHEVVVIGESRPDPRDWSSWEWPVESIPVVLPRSPSAAGARWLGETLEALDVDIAISAHPYSTLLLAKARLTRSFKWRTLATVHNSPAGSWFRQKFYALAQRRYWRGIDSYAVVSPHLASYLPKPAAGGAHVLPNGVRTPEIQRSSGLSDEPRSRLLYVGRLEPRKGVEDVLAVAENRSNYSVTIAGSGVLEELVLDASVRLPNLHYAGWVESAASLYAEADYLLFPSETEGHSLVLGEALNAGLPPLTKDIAAVRHLRLPTLLVQPGDQDYLAHVDRAVGVPSAEYRQLEDSCKSVWQRCYSPDAAAEPLRRVIKALLQEDRK